jgi:hypothetical protein
MTTHQVLTFAFGCVAASFFMVLQDTFADSMTIAEARNIPKWPGRLDAANDYVSKYGAAIIAVGAVRYGLWSIQTFVVVSCVAATSYVTTNRVTALAHRFFDRVEAKRDR